MKNIFFTLFLFVAGAQGALYAQKTNSALPDTTSDGKRIYHTERLSTEVPEIDGILDDLCWQKQGYWSGDFLQYMPDEGAEPLQETEIKVLYDDKNIYVAIRAYDQPEKIDRQLGRRDDFAGDIVGVCFDSYYDHRTGFEFDLTASGGKLDLVLLNEGWDTNWDAVWYGEVGMEDSAWTAEMKIPLTQLRYGSKQQQVWGFHAWRWLNREQAESQWNLIPRDTPGMLYSIGELHGISDLPKNRRIEILPYALAKYQSSEPQPPFFDGRQQKFALGMDGKIGLSSDFTLDFTINPDFGQVEADPSVLNLSVFETFFEEKRPFFLEGKNILDFDIGNNQLFYSRRIGASPSFTPDTDMDQYLEMPQNSTILGAAKITGKTQNGLSVGVVESLTRRETAQIESVQGTEEQTVEPLTNYLIARVQKDYNRGTTMLGGMFTATHRKIGEEHLEFLPHQAYSGGLDFRHLWKNKTYFMNLKTIFSHLRGDTQAMIDLQERSSRYFQRPDAEHVSIDSTLRQLNGFGGNFEIGKESSGNWRFAFELDFFSPGLELNDVGFMTQTDYIKPEFWFGYKQDKPQGIFRSYEVFAGVENTWSFGGEFGYNALFFLTSAKFKNKWNASGRVLRISESFDNQRLRGGPRLYNKGFWCNNFTVSTNHSKKVGFSFRYHFHIPDDGVSYEHDFFPSVVAKLTSNWQTSLEMSYSNHITYLHYVATQDEHYILGTLDRKTLGMTLRMDYAITPEFTIQYYGNPYISVGKYTDFKRVKAPSAQNYDDLFDSLAGNEISFSPGENQYTVSDPIDNSNYCFDNPDFNFRQFRSNLVLRWEFKPGSRLYLVWTHNRSEYEEISKHSVFENIGQLFDNHPENVFLLKFNYWFSV